MWAMRIHSVEWQRRRHRRHHRRHWSQKRTETLPCVCSETVTHGTEKLQLRVDARVEPPPPHCWLWFARCSVGSVSFSDAGCLFRCGYMRSMPAGAMLSMVTFWRCIKQLLAVWSLSRFTHTSKKLRLVHHFPVLHFPSLWIGPFDSSPAFPTPPPKLLGPFNSSPAFSVASFSVGDYGSVCEYHCKWLTGKTGLWNDTLCVDNL